MTPVSGVAVPAADPTQKTPVLAAAEPACAPSSGTTPTATDRYDNRWPEARRDHLAAVRREEEGEHDGECDCPDCSEAEWTRQQEAALSEPPARPEVIDKREMRRRE